MMRTSTSHVEALKAEEAQTTDKDNNEVTTGVRRRSSKTSLPLPNLVMVITSALSVARTTPNVLRVKDTTNALHNATFAKSLVISRTVAENY